MRTTFTLLALICVTALGLVLGCEKIDSPLATDTPTATARRGGNGNGRGPSSGGVVTNPVDSLLTNCGIVVDSAGVTLPTITLTNLTSRHVTGYSYDPRDGSYYPYDVLVISFDAPTIAGQVVDCFTLLADQCQGRVVCTPTNGVPLSQVTTCGSGTTITLPVGVSWLSVSVPSYTGYIQVSTAAGCLYLSQPFTFTPPRVLNL